MFSLPIFSLNSFATIGDPVGIDCSKTTSSSQKSQYIDKYSCDGDLNTKWSSGATSATGAWITYKLEKLALVSRVKINWENAYAKEYVIQVSISGKDNEFREIADYNNGSAGEMIFSVDVLARYIRIRPRKFAGSGCCRTYSIYETTVSAVEPERADLVNIFMGSNNDGSSFSRGNKYPAVQIPYGMHALTIGHKLNDPWFYSYKNESSPDTELSRPSPRNNDISGIKFTHMPSPWVGDYATFEIHAGYDDFGTYSYTDAKRQGQNYKRDETGRPYFYENLLRVNGRLIDMQMVPTTYGAMIRYKFREGEDYHGPIEKILISMPKLGKNSNRSGGESYYSSNNKCAGATSKKNVDCIEGRLRNSHNKLGREDGNPPELFYHIAFDNDKISSHSVSFPPRVQSLADSKPLAELTLSLSSNDWFEMRVGVSYIGANEAADNVKLDQKSGGKWKSFDDLVSDAKTAWNEHLNKIEVSGGSDEDTVTFYSTLYRVGEFPKVATEKVGSVYKYYNPFNEGSIETATSGTKFYAGNGFWDTYRGFWPLMSILYPQKSAEMMQGFIEASHYKPYNERDKWTVRWSSPGYVYSMLGTHTDIITGEMAKNGFITGAALDKAYQAALKNGLVNNNQNLDLHLQGRYRNMEWAYLGFIKCTIADGDECTKYGNGDAKSEYTGSRAVEHAVNDMGIALLAEQKNHTDLAYYFKNRAMGYLNLWDANNKVFAAPGKDGSHITDDVFEYKYGDETYRQSFNPRTWRYGWAEGNSYNYNFAPMWDGNGLRKLFQKETDDLDNYVTNAILGSKPIADSGIEQSQEKGNYGSFIHEMKESKHFSLKSNNGERDLGQFWIGNQPAQHMLHMLNFDKSGGPALAQDLVRAVQKGNFRSGFSNGHGYAGDEDNGQTSSWYVMTAMGFYSATKGHSQFHINTPLFNKAVITSEDNKKLTITADNATSRYISSAKLNNAVHNQPYLNYTDFRQSNSTLDFTTSEVATDWAQNYTEDSDKPNSITGEDQGEHPRYFKDLLNLKGVSVTDGGADNPEGENETYAVDNDPDTKWLVHNNTGYLEVDFKGIERHIANYYTITSGNDFPDRDPREWTLKGYNGSTWVNLHSINGSRFKYREGINVYYFDNDTAYQKYKFDFINSGAIETQVTEIELLCIPRGDVSVSDCDSVKVAPTE